MTRRLADSIRRLSRPVAVAAAAALAALGNALAPLSACRAEEPDLYSFDVVLAPVCLDGTFPLTIQTPGGAVQADLHVDTDVKGRLHGFVEVNGVGFGLSGSVQRGEGLVHVSFKASSGGARIKFVGDVPDGATTLSGTATGKGYLAPGTNPFTVDLSSAGPQTATIECAITQDAKGRIQGIGHVLACGADVALKASGRIGPAGVIVALKQGRSFKFAGTGAAGGADIVVDWTASGFGGSASGTALLFIPVRPPEPLTYPPIPGEFELDAVIPSIIPRTGDAPRGRFTVAPPLPAGLALDPATGRITGIPTEVQTGRPYTVTASNYAGSSTATIAFGTRIPRARSFAPDPRFLTDADHKHFLARAEFGLRQLGGGQTTLTRVKSIGLDAYVDSMLVFSKTGPAEAIAAPELYNFNDPVNLRGKFPSPTQLARWWSSLLINSDNPFQERLAFFWADRFAVSSDSLEVGEAHFMQEYVNLFRYEGNGNLRPLLLKMARSGAMLKYLDGVVNTVSAPNENFSREFWELFTLGVDVRYTQADIVEGARAFTGWKFVTDPTTHLVTPVFDTALHDPNPKTVLGQAIAGGNDDDYQEMVDITLDHAPVAEFVTTKIFEHFAFDDPHPALVADMAAYLRQQNYELAPFVKALFKSEAFFSTTARAALVKNPIEYSIGFIHLTGLKITPSAFQTQLATLGQSPTEAPSVNGWPLGTMWFSAQNMADRANFVEVCLGDTARQASAGINVANILPREGQRSAPEVVDSLAALFGLTLVADERQKCLDFLNLNGPFDGSSQAVIDDKVRGLLFVLAQHPTYEIR